MHLTCIMVYVVFYDYNSSCTGGTFSLAGADVEAVGVSESAHSVGSASSVGIGSAVADDVAAVFDDDAEVEVEVLGLGARGAFLLSSRNTCPGHISTYISLI